MPDSPDPPGFPCRPPTRWPAGDCDDLGEPFDAFPVESPFQVRPDLVKLAPADDWLRVDRQWPAMLAAKLVALTGADGLEGADNIMLAAPADDLTERARLAAILRAGEKLAASDAGRRLGLVWTRERITCSAAGYHGEVGQGQAAGGQVRLQADRADAAPVVQALAAGRGGSGLLGALAMSLQEDLVLMEQGPDGVARAVVFHVSFPSAWDPAAKLGQDLLGLHAPVADNASLQAAAARLGSVLVGKGPFVRWVWTVTADPRWRAWPPLPAPAADLAFDASGRLDCSGPEAASHAPLYFRLERQTTMPLAEGYGLFLIRVQVRPLTDVLAQSGRLALLQAALRSMSEPMVRYKSLAAARARVLAM